MTILGWIKSLSDVVFPRLCPICGAPLVEGEELMCLKCLVDMPKLEYNPTGVTAIDHAMMLQPKILRVASLYRYRRSDPYALLIQKAKYGGRYKVAFQLGEMLAAELKPQRFFDGIDMILPVPLHWTKRLRRGYNQSEHIAYGIAKATGIPVADNLIALRSHATQTHKTDAERQQGVAGVFGVIRPDELEGKHVLIVDDVITTGATIRECALSLRRAVARIDISAASVAFARHGS